MSNKNIYCHLYAADTIILKGVSDRDSLIAGLVRELRNVDQWFINKMTIKTKQLYIITFFASKAHLKKLLEETDCRLHLKENKIYWSIFYEKMQWKYKIKYQIRQNKSHCIFYDATI